MSTKFKKFVKVTMCDVVFQFLMWFFFILFKEVLNFNFKNLIIACCILFFVFLLFYFFVFSKWVDRVNINTAMANMQNDKKRLLPYFPTKFLYHLIAYPDRYLEEANNTLDKLMRLYMKDKEYNQAMVIKLDKNNIHRELDEFNWVRLKTLIETYSKIRIKSIESGEDDTVNSDMIGYYNYLISSNRLNKVDKMRLYELRQLLGLED